MRSDEEGVGCGGLLGRRVPPWKQFSFSSQMLEGFCFLEIHNFARNMCVAFCSRLFRNTERRFEFRVPLFLHFRDPLLNPTCPQHLPGAVSQGFPLSLCRVVFASVDLCLILYFSFLSTAITAIISEFPSASLIPSSSVSLLFVHSFAAFLSIITVRQTSFLVLRTHQ